MERKTHTHTHTEQKRERERELLSRPTGQLGREMGSPDGIQII